MKKKKKFDVLADSERRPGTSSACRRSIIHHSHLANEKEKLVAGGQTWSAS